MNESNGLEPINIAYCGDVGMFEAFLLSSLSVAKTTSRALHFYFLTGNASEIDPSFTPLTSTQVAFIGDALKRHNPFVTVEIMDCTEVYRKELSRSINVRTSYSPYSLFRLIMDYFPLPDKLLYLDADVLALGDIGILFDTDLGSNDLGMVQDAVGHRFFGKAYGNSGVLLLNLAGIRKDGLLIKARAIANRFRLFMPDQTTLNIVFKKKKLLLSPKFNEQVALRADTIIRHYCKRLCWFPYIHTINVKPWNIEAFKKHFGPLHSDLLTEFATLRNEYSKIPH